MFVCVWGMGIVLKGMGGGVDWMILGFLLPMIIKMMINVFSYFNLML